MKNAYGKRKVLKIFIVIVIIFICFFISLIVRQHLKVNNALAYFGEFYTTNTLDILKENIKPVQSSMDSENYKITLNGVWAQGNCASCIFEIQEKRSGTAITQKDIQSVIWNKNLEDHSEGNLVLGGVKYKEKENGNHILEIRILSEDNVEQSDIEIKIKEEQFLFTIPMSSDQNAKQVVCVNDDVEDRVYISPISMCAVLSLDREITTSEIYLNFSNGERQEIEVDGNYVSSEKENSKIYMLFLEMVCDVEQLESVTIGEITYKVIRTE